jgi:hypothetical protein
MSTPPRMSFIPMLSSSSLCRTPSAWDVSGAAELPGSVPFTFQTSLACALVFIDVFFLPWGGSRSFSPLGVPSGFRRLLCLGDACCLSTAAAITSRRSSVIPRNFATLHRWNTATREHFSCFLLQSSHATCPSRFVQIFPFAIHLLQFYGDSSIPRSVEKFV